MVRKKFIGFSLMLVLLLVSCSSAQPPSTPVVQSPDSPVQSGEPELESETSQPSNSGEEQAETVSSLESCLVGTWNVDNFDNYVASMIPQGALGDATFEYRGERGSLDYAFSESGELTVTANEFQARSIVTQGENRYLLDMILVGTVRGTYELEEGQLTIGEISEDKMEYTAVMDGYPMMQSRNVEEYLPLFLATHQVTETDCSGDKLDLYMVDFPQALTPITLERDNG